MTSGGSLVAFPLGELRYFSPEDISDAVSVQEHASSPKSDVWALGVILIEMVTGSSPFQPTSADSKGLYNLMLQIIQFCGLDVSIPLLEKKMDDLHFSDLELLRQRESGIAGYASNTSPSSKFDAISELDFSISSKMLYEDREAAHALLLKQHTCALSEWFKQPAFANISEDLKELIEICLTVDPEKRPSPAQLLSHPYLRYFPFCTEVSVLTKSDASTATCLIKLRSNKRGFPSP
jgi:serine/threonine protein kinase